MSSGSGAKLTEMMTKEIMTVMKEKKYDTNLPIRPQLMVVLNALMVSDYFHLHIMGGGASTLLEATSGAKRQDEAIKSMVDFSVTGNEKIQFVAFEDFAVKDYKPDVEYVFSGNEVYELRTRDHYDLYVQTLGHHRIGDIHGPIRTESTFAEVSRKLSRALLLWYQSGLGSFTRIPIVHSELIKKMAIILRGKRSNPHLFVIYNLLSGDEASRLQLIEDIVTSVNHLTRGLDSGQGKYVFTRLSGLLKLGKFVSGDHVCVSDTSLTDDRLAASVLNFIKVNRSTISFFIDSVKSSMTLNPTLRQSVLALETFIREMSMLETKGPYAVIQAVVKIVRLWEEPTLGKRPWKLREKGGGEAGKTFPTRGSRREVAQSATTEENDCSRHEDGVDHEADDYTGAGVDDQDLEENLHYSRSPSKFDFDRRKHNSSSTNDPRFQNEYTDGQGHRGFKGGQDRTFTRGRGSGFGRGRGFTGNKGVRFDAYDQSRSEQKDWRNDGTRSHGAEERKPEGKRLQGDDRRRPQDDDWRRTANANVGSHDENGPHDEETVKEEETMTTAMVPVFSQMDNWDNNFWESNSYDWGDQEVKEDDQDFRPGFN